MAQPDPYDRDFDFEGFQSSHPSTPLPGDKLNVELDAISGVVDEILARIADLQRDDLEAANALIGYDQLKPELRNGFSTPTVWATATAYEKGASVYLGRKVYAALIAHTSGTFSVDLAAGKWYLLADFTEVTAVDQAAADAALAAAASAAAALVSQTASASSASSSSDSAAASANSAAAALVSENAAAVSAAGAAQAVTDAIGVTVQGHSTNLDDIASVTPGAAGLSILAHSLAADVRNYLDVAPYVADRTALKALDTTKDTVVRLGESGREGVFKWTLGNFSTHIAADTQEGIYVKATAIAATVGAWVRETVGGEWNWSWFGIVGTSTVGADAAPAINAYMAIAEIVKPAMTRMGSGVFPLDSRIATASHQWGLRGVKSSSQQTILYKRYVEADEFLGVISASIYGVDWRDFDIRADSSIDRGGSAWSIINGVSDPLIGGTNVHRVNVSGGRGFNYNYVLDGSANTNVSGPGLRDMFWSDSEGFGTKIASAFIKSTYNLTANGINLKAGIGTGSSSKALILTGTTDSVTTNLRWNGAIRGEVDLDWMTNWFIESPIQSNITNTANVDDGLWVGAYITGTIQNNWLTSRVISNNNADWEIIQVDNPAGAANLNYSSLSAYRSLHISGKLMPATDSQNLYLRIGTGTVASGASDYAYQHVRASTGSPTAASGVGSAATSFIAVSPSAVGNAANEGVTFDLTIEDLNLAEYTWVTGRSHMTDASGAFFTSTFGGQRLEAAAHDVVRLLFASGNMSGHIVLRGLRR